MRKFELIAPVDIVYLSQYFGENRLPLYKELGMLGHNGLDYATGHGTPVYATHDGTVISAGLRGQAGYRVDIITDEQFQYKDGGAYFMTVYMHNLPNLPVKAGRKVKMGDLIGYADNTGASEGDHCHKSLLPMVSMGSWYDKLEPNNGYSGCIDPLPFLLKKPNGTFYTPKDVRSAWQQIKELKLKLGIK
jgi:murein DD-endopeptidase MepM/ murein hydrolase activator NlpD